MQKIKNDLKPYFKLQNYKQFLVPTLVMFGIYLLGISSILRANVSYIDDLFRAITGVRGWAGGWSRWTTEFGSIAMNVDSRITDMSPLPQIFAAFFLAVSSVVFVYILCNKKISVLALAASIPVGLTPYFLQCISFKFDAPYMALSILASVVPFLFIENRKFFVASSLIGLLIMCTSYQASSGIYIMMVVIISFQWWINKQKTYKDIFKFILIATLCYCAALLLFQLSYIMFQIFVKAHSMTYASTEISINIVENLKQYYSLVRSDFSVVWKALILLIIACFFVTTFILSRRNKFATIFVSIAVIIILFASAFGVYVIFKQPFLAPRGMYGVGISIAILSVIITSKKWFAVPAIVLSWCFFGFAFSYGNALNDQKRYADFRAEILLHDLSALYPNDNNLQVVIKGDVGFSPVVKNVAVKNPIITRLVPLQFGGPNGYSYFNFSHYYNFNITTNESEYFTEADTLLLDSHYHTIKTDGKQVLVILK